MKRVLIGCASSCVVLDAFLARGYDAWQCDLLSADKPTTRHIQDDIRNVLDLGWDMLICNPPCTRLCNSGVRWRLWSSMRKCRIGWLAKGAPHSSCAIWASAKPSPPTAPQRRLQMDDIDISRGAVEHCITSQETRRTARWIEAKT